MKILFLIQNFLPRSSFPCNITEVRRLTQRTHVTLDCTYHMMRHFYKHEMTHDCREFILLLISLIRGCESKIQKTPLYLNTCICQEGYETFLTFKALLFLGISTLKANKKSSETFTKTSYISSRLRIGDILEHMKYRTPC
jgi:hypothetical protein